jgi:transitional endoplasmic reticulum ATPase
VSGEEEYLSPVAAALAGEARDVRRALQVLGQILTDAAPTGASFEAFVHASLGRSMSGVVCETRWLTTLGHVAVAMTLAGAIDTFDPAIGPADDEAPTWSSLELGDDRYTYPAQLALHFAAGQLAPSPVVVRLLDPNMYNNCRLQVYSAPEHRAYATKVLEAIVNTAEKAKRLYRGRALIASASSSLTIEPTELADITRADVVVPDDVWAEIDLNVASVTVHRDLMEGLGLGVRRGVLLAGPPGVGKSAVSQVIARELLGDFTVIYVDARAGAHALSAVYKEAVSLSPALIVIEDIDLIVTHRHAQGSTGSLSEFLAAMDAHPTAPLLTLASTNDVSTLDAAAIRSARFDSIIELGYPNLGAATRILESYLRGVPGGGDVDVAYVATFFASDTSGADIREVVRRTVLASGGVVGTSELVTTVKSGRFRAQMPEGNYL